MSYVRYRTIFFMVCTTSEFQNLMSSKIRLQAGREENLKLVSKDCKKQVKSQKSKDFFETFIVSVRLSLAPKSKILRIKQRQHHTTSQHRNSQHRIATTQPQTEYSTYQSINQSINQSTNQSSKNNGRQIPKIKRSNGERRRRNRWHHQRDWRNEILRRGAISLGCSRW